MNSPGSRLESLHAAAATEVVGLALVVDMTRRAGGVNRHAADGIDDLRLRDDVLMGKHNGAALGLPSIDVAPADYGARVRKGSKPARPVRPARSADRGTLAHSGRPRSYVMRGS